MNGERVDVLVDGTKTLLEVLREDLQLTGTKHGCELGECGACAVLVDGEPVLSCLALAIDYAGTRVTTSKGSPRTAGCIRCRRRSPTSAPRSAATARRASSSRPRRCSIATRTPSRERIREALSGNLCRCTGYLQIFEAVEAAVAAGTRR